jgi:uncharacterized protein
MAKTALDLTPEGLQRYNPAKRIDSKQVEERWAETWELVPQFASILKEQFGATQVVVFGSLTDKNRYTPWSDIDLAVWGITPRQFFYRAFGILNEVSSEFKVNLVDPTNRTCRLSVKQAIEQTGVTV